MNKYDDVVLESAEQEIASLTARLAEVEGAYVELAKEYHLRCLHDWPFAECGYTPCMRARTALGEGDRGG